MSTDEDMTEFIRDMGSPTDGPDLTDEELEHLIRMMDSSQRFADLRFAVRLVVDPGCKDCRGTGWIHAEPVDSNNLQPGPGEDAVACECTVVVLDKDLTDGQFGIPDWMQV